MGGPRFPDEGVKLIACDPAQGVGCETSWRLELKTIFITGGAGFIGKRLALSLRAKGHSVTVLDSLLPQVHSDAEGAVRDLNNAGVATVIGDVRDTDKMASIIVKARAEVIVHLAAETGTGQSYDLPVRYCDVNVTGTASVIEAARAAREAGVLVERMLLAGSRAVYGEGACLDAEGHAVTAVPRLTKDLAAGDFAPKSAAGLPLQPMPSRAASTIVAPASVYASTKLMQEYLFRQTLEQSEIACGILRLQNVYGAGQSLYNPYTGVLSIFAQQLLKGGTLNIFEDGEIVRDFVHVSDVVAAFHQLCEIERVPTMTIDIGSGQRETILDVAKLMISTLGLEGDRLAISGQFRPGDIRHALADIADAESLLGWAPKVSLQAGVVELLDWARSTL